MASNIDPSAVFSQLTEGFMKLPLLQKVIFPLLIVGSIAGIVFVSRWANSPDYTVLFTELPQPDAASVVARLKEMKVKYEIRGDGSTIAISPPELVHELRMTLASEGVPKGGTVGLELFDSASLGATTFQEKVKFMRALQGELERTIGSLAAVQSARVHIAQPERSVFAKKSSEPTASVVLKLRSTDGLEKQQIRGIANLVAGSIEGLKKENVTIVDVYGNLLYPTEEEEKGLGGESTRISYQREIEHGYAQRVEQMLTKVLGPGRAIARVTAEMDFSSNEREEESYDPGGQVIRSERSVAEGEGTQARGGIAGVVSNLTNDPNLVAPQNGAKEANNRSEQIKNYEVSRAVIKTSQPRGKLTKLSVAVLVDGAYEEKPGAKPGDPKVYKPLESEKLSQIENLVRNAVGFDTQRGDTLTVENIPFFTPEESIASALDKKATYDFVFNSIYRAGPVLFIVLFFFVVVRPLVRFLVTPTEAEVDLQRLLPTGIQELEKELEGERQKNKSLPDYEPAVDLEQLEEIMGENSRLVKENPQQAALLIRYWLNDGRM